MLNETKKITKHSGLTGKGMTEVLRPMSFWGIIIYCLSWTCASYAQEQRSAMVINYGQIEIGVKKAYQEDLLMAVLESTRNEFGPYKLNLVKDTENWSTRRYLQILERGQLINLSWGALNWSSPGAYNLTQIPYPILKGLGGFRFLMLHEQTRSQYAQVKSLEDLTQFKSGMVTGWGDMDILEYNDIEVEHVPMIDSLYAMLASKRFDNIPLSILEIKDELAVAQKYHPDLAIDSHLLIAYPFPIYFQASNHYPDLVRRIEQGMKTITENGELDRIFHNHFGQLLEDLRLHERQLIRLNNPYVPSDVSTDLEAIISPP